MSPHHPCIFHARTRAFLLHSTPADPVWPHRPSLRLLSALCASALSLSLSHHQESPKDAPEYEFSSGDASFGPELPEDGLNGKIVLAQSIDCEPNHTALIYCDYACGEIQRSNVTGNSIALIRRGPTHDDHSNCTFSTKVHNAQRAGFNAVIIFNDLPHEDPIPMKGSPGVDVNISSVFITYEDAMLIRALWHDNPNYAVDATLFANEEMFSNFLFLFVSIIAGTSVVFTLFLFYRRHMLTQRRTKRKRMSKRQVMKLPTRSFKPDDAEETCVICLDNFKRGNTITVLPCNHIYHKKCITPWLSERQRVCCICKRDPAVPMETPTEASPLLQATPYTSDSSDSSDSSEDDDAVDVETGSDVSTGPVAVGQHSVNQAERECPDSDENSDNNTA